MCPISLNSSIFSKLGSVCLFQINSKKYTLMLFIVGPKPIASTETDQAEQAYPDFHRGRFNYRSNLLETQWVGSTLDSGCLALRLGFVGCFDFCFLAAIEKILFLLRCRSRFLVSLPDGGRN